MRILFLDDNQDRHNQFRQTRDKKDELVAVFTAKACISAFTGPRFDLIFLDHDLGDFQETPDLDWTGRPLDGTDVAEALSNIPKEKFPDQVIIHSWNPEGARRMQDRLRAVGMNVVCSPFGVGEMFF